MKFNLYKNKIIIFSILFTLGGCLSPYPFGKLSEVPEESWEWNFESSQKILNDLEQDHQKSQQTNQNLRKKNGLEVDF